MFIDTRIDCGHEKILLENLSVMCKFQLNPLGSSKYLLKRLLGEANYFTVRAYYHYQFDKLRGKTPLFVYSMGKVGSTTIANSLNILELEREMKIYQPHFLSPKGISLLYQLHENGYGGPDKFTSRVNNSLAVNRVVGKQVRKGSPRDMKFKVVTLVRDPVATNISGFFHQYCWWPSDLQRRCREEPASCLEDLIDRFFSHYPHNVPIEWFDMELAPVFGVDVFSERFPKEKGYQILQGERAEVLILKLEMLNESAADAFLNFLGIDNFALVKDNIGGDKWYGAIYNRFKEIIPIPDSYLNLMYQSKYTQHFYTDEEINAFIFRWSSTTTSNPKELGMIRN